MMGKWTRAFFTPCMPLGDNNSRITACEKHIELSRRAAREGAVLLKNEDKTLPLKKGQKVAILGKAQIDYVKGGGGSGDTKTPYVRNIYEGMKLKKDKVDVISYLSNYYEEYVEKMYKEGNAIGKFDEAEVPYELIKKAAKETDVAIVTINRYSAEGSDRYNDGKDMYFVLSDNEKATVKAACDNFEKIIILLNVGAMIDTAWFSDNDKIKAALMLWQGGMEGGLAAADLLTGDANPSGKLVDTCAIAFDDYPSSEGFHESKDYVKYTEDIFVGYRYFETIPGKKERVVYPFGFGLSYTTFEINNITATNVGKKITISADIKNTGDYAGKEVLEVYYEAPQGKITKPKRELCAFSKTPLLAPGESCTVTASYNIEDMASYDDKGDIKKSAYIMEKGRYNIYVGNSVRDAKKIDYSYELQNDVIVEQLTELVAPENLGKRMLSDGSYEVVPDRKIIRQEYPCEYVCEYNPPKDEEDIKLLMDVYEGKISLDEFLTQLSDEELMTLLSGHPNTGVADTRGMGNLMKFGVPNVMTCDGPAGVHLCARRRIATWGKTTAQLQGVTSTAFPVATALACSWDVDLLEEIGKAGALEAKENNLQMWLTPALNIHRSPLCGRNFEYYSEDPYISGKMAAAMVRGIQSQNIVATPKHFACNNKETNRGWADSILSERALREIYLKGFEICIKESKPKLLMTAYNKVNGLFASENAEMLTGILRGEWGYEGMITTDWWNNAEHYKEVKAGNDIRMPDLQGQLKEPYEKGLVTRNEMAACAKRVLKTILWVE